MKRPREDVELGNVWGLPATTLKEGELPEEGVKRGGEEKLGCEIEPTEFMGAMAQERKNYILNIRDYEAKIVKDSPDVTKGSYGTKYVEQKWTSDMKILMPACKKGSWCVQIFMNKLGFWPKEKFILKL